MTKLERIKKILIEQINKCKTEHDLDVFVRMLVYGMAYMDYFNTTDKRRKRK